MIRGSSPPKHRHDGTSPLPLGMDWSPPPKKWNGRDTIWPHDPRTGWSYCVTIPSWVALPKSRSSASDPVVSENLGPVKWEGYGCNLLLLISYGYDFVRLLWFSGEAINFYRVQVGIQSPAGVTTTRGVLRRFNDFLKLFSDLKRAFPKKSLPSAPPKGLLRMKSRALLEERRYSLEEWVSKLLSDIDISRSMPVASFLELETAARSSFQEANLSETNPSTNNIIFPHQIHPTSSLSALAGGSSVASDYGSDTAYDTSELGSLSLGRDDGSEAGLEELTVDGGFTNPIENLVKYSMSNIEEGLLMGESILDQLEGFKKDKVHTRHIADNGSSASKTVPLAVNHTRKPSNESIGSDLSSCKGSEMSNLWAPNLLSEASLDLTSGGEVSRTMSSNGSPELQCFNGGKLILPGDQQPKLDRILMIMQRRLVTAKTDMEDLIMRLDQEVAVKEYLTTKVKDLEVELETSKEKSKETLQQALSLEKERITKMQWDMEELRRKSLEMELKLKSQEDFKLPTESTSLSTFSEKNELLKELEATKGHLNILLKQHEELEVKSKSDIKVLVKEVKSLRRSQNELKQKLQESLQENFEVKQLLQQEMEQSERALAARRKLLHDCQALQSQLQHCNVKFADDPFVADSSSMLDVLHLLAESDKQVGQLLAETQCLAPEGDTLPNGDDMDMVDHELRLVLRDIVANNEKLRKQVNLFIRSAFKTDNSTTTSEAVDQEALSRETLLKQVLET